MAYVEAPCGDEPVLVGIVPRLSDWAILEQQHWYRVPVKSALDMTPSAEYLAFYQPKVFGDERWAVNYYAEVTDLRVAKRIELLPNEPNHVRARDDYYQFTIGDLQKLASPIPSNRWRRIVFIPSTFGKLMSAYEINDLYHTSPIEDTLHGAMQNQDIEAERQYFVREAQVWYCLDFGVFCRDGKIDVECDGETYHGSKEAQTRDRRRNNELTSYGWSVLRFSGSEISSDTQGCIDRIRRTTETLKGLDKTWREGR
jgi:very-short-patch-repair endonuclease